MEKKLLELKNLSKFFLREDSSKISILEDINLEFKEGEIVGIVGRSGCGKSTLLRIITGLIPASSGEILFKNNPINYENTNFSMVFQTFALLPWLTVFENIAIGLSTKNFSKDELKTRVLKSIELVGLSGFESAFPKEISGGMRQRVGFARAMAVDPEILILDEPFSALDYLTATILKSDLLDLWYERSISSIKSIILVTHSVEEAISLCDRIIILSSNPGKIIANLEVKMPHPRDSESPEFHNMLENIYSSITSKNKELKEQKSEVNIHARFPQRVSISRLIAFVKYIKTTQVNGHVNIQDIGKKLNLNYDALSAILDSLLLLKFIDINSDDLSITSAGNILLDADNKIRKVIIKEHLVNYVPFIKEVYHALQVAHSGWISKKLLYKILGDAFGDVEANNIINYTINWARYAGLFNYDAKRERLILLTA